MRHRESWPHTPTNAHFSLHLDILFVDLLFLCASAVNILIGRRRVGVDERERYGKGLEVRRAVLGGAHVDRTLKTKRRSTAQEFSHRPV